MHTALTLVLFFCQLASGGRFDRLCSRIYFDYTSEANFSYINILNGVYLKTNEIEDDVPVYANERDGNVYFSYNRLLAKFYFFAGPRKYVGLMAHANRDQMTNDLWISYVNNTNAFGSAISYFYYYQPDRPMIKATIILRCVSFTDCGSNNLVFTSNIGTKNETENDPRIHHFIPLYNLFRSDRPVYKHSNNKTKWFLFYHGGHWIVGDNYTKADGFLSVESAAQKPEFVVEKWRHIAEEVWVESENNFQCQGSFDEPCSQQYCSNRGKCNTNSLNASFCTCLFGYKGKQCEQRTLLCSRLDSNFKTVNYEFGAVTTMFCPKYSPTPIRKQLCEKYKNQSLSWYNFDCAAPVYPITTSTTTTTTTTTTTPTTTTTTTPKPLNLDENKAASISIKVLVILVPILLPFIHYCWYNVNRSKKGKELSNILRTCSLHAYIASYVWIVFIVLYFTYDLKIYGLTTTGYVMVTAWFFVVFNYFFILIETCLSSERQYLSTKSENDDTVSFITTLCEAKPTITTRMECFHMEQSTRQVSYTDANGNVQYRTETYQEKKTTWAGYNSFGFHHWKDVSEMSTIPVCTPNTILRVKLIKNIDFADEETSLAFNNQLVDFINRNKHRDVQYDFDTAYDINNFKEHIMCYDKNSKPPFWMNIRFFWLAWCLICIWPYRLLLSKATTKQNFNISKLVSMTPITDDNQVYVNDSIPNASQINLNLQPDEGELLPPPPYSDVVGTEMQTIVKY